MPIPNLGANTLYLSLGFGGRGVAGANGGNGISSYVTVYPNTTATHCIAFANSGNGGAVGTATAGGAGGTGGGGLSTSTTMPLGWGSLVALRQGVAGTAGGFAAAGVATTAVAVSGYAYPGTGGGGLPAAGVAGFEIGRAHV
jgi:hypothetical protein